MHKEGGQNEGRPILYSWVAPFEPEVDSLVLFDYTEESSV